MAASLPSPDKKDRDWLSLFTRDFTTPLELNKKYTLFVKFLRLALPAAAFVIVGILVARLAGEDPNQPMRIQDAPVPTQAEAVMVDARYEGMDAEKRPYTITADRVARALSEPDLIELEQPMADITLSDNTWLAANAKIGRYNQKSGRLYLQGLVRLFHDAGYELITEEMDIDLTAGRAWTETRVQGQGPKGTIVSQGLLIEGSGRQIIFLGPVKLTLLQTETP